MRQYIPTLLAAALLVSTTRDITAQNATLIRNVRIFTGQELVTGADVLIRDTKIAAVGHALTAPSARIVDGAGKTLIPGLIDAHVHTMSRFTPQQALAFGVTTEIDLHCQVALCAELQKEQLRGPVTDRADVLSALTAVTVPKGHGTEYFPVPTITNPDSAKAFVDARIAEGSQWIKVIYTVGYPQRPLPTLDLTTVRAVVAAAHRRGKLVVVHIDALSSAREVIEAGADGLVHSFTDVAPDAEFGRFMAAHHAFMIPTLSVRMGAADTTFYQREAIDPSFAPYLTMSARTTIASGARGFPGVYSAAEAQVRQMRDAGARVLAGTDAPNRGTSHGSSLHGEMLLLTRAGLTPIEALVAATSAAAAAFRLHDRGRITAGLRADLILVDGDPTRDINATRNIVTIWKNGAVFNRNAFARMANPPARGGGGRGGAR